MVEKRFDLSTVEVAGSRWQSLAVAGSRWNSASRSRWAPNIELLEVQQLIGFIGHHEELVFPKQGKKCQFGQLLSEKERKTCKCVLLEHWCCRMLPHCGACEDCIVDDSGCKSWVAPHGPPRACWKPLLVRRFIYSRLFSTLAGYSVTLRHILDRSQGLLLITLHAK